MRAIRRRLLLGLVALASLVAVLLPGGYLDQVGTAVEDVVDSPAQASRSGRVARADAVSTRQCPTGMEDMQTMSMSSMGCEPSP
jgi:hypothetical protein